MKKFFKKIWVFIQMLFTSPETWIEQNILPSIELVNTIKNIVDSKVLVGITDLTPTSWDNVLRAKFSEHLNKVILILSNIEILAGKNLNYDEFIEWLHLCTPTTRAAIYAKIAAKLAQYNGGNDAKIKNASIDLLTQLTYVKLKQNINEEELPNDAEDEPLAANNNLINGFATLNDDVV